MLFYREIMLKEIYSSVIKQKTIKFHKGLNVVLGDNNASNSIGKSTMLLIIDGDYIRQYPDTRGKVY